MEHTGSLMIGWLLPLGKSVSGKFNHISSQAMSHLRSFFFFAFFSSSRASRYKGTTCYVIAAKPHASRHGWSFLVQRQTTEEAQLARVQRPMHGSCDGAYNSISLGLKSAFSIHPNFRYRLPWQPSLGKEPPKLLCRAAATKHFSSNCLLRQTETSRLNNLASARSLEREPAGSSRRLHCVITWRFSSPRYRRPLRWKRLFASSLQLFVLLFSRTRNKGLLVRYAWPRDAGNLRFDKRGPTRGGPPVGGGGQWRWENSALFKKTLMRWDTQHSCGHADCFISLLISPLLSHVQTRFKSVQHLISSHVSNISCGTNRVPLRRWTARSALCLSCRGAWSHTNLH